MKAKFATIALTTIALCISSAKAVDVSWDTDAASGIQGGTGNWNTVTDTNWTLDDGASRTAWDNGAWSGYAALMTAGSGTITVTGTINLNELAVTSTAESIIGGIANSVYLVSGGGLNFGSSAGLIDTSATGLRNSHISSNLSGSAGLAISASGVATGQGRLVLNGDNSGLTGGIAINSGLVSFIKQSAAGSNAITLNGGGIFGAVDQVGPAATLIGGGDQVLSNQLVLADSSANLVRVWGSRNLTLSGNISGTGGFQKTDAGQLILKGASSFSGKVTVAAGTLAVTSLNSTSGGAATSALGAPTNSSDGTINLSTAGQATIAYMGGGETSDRVINFATGSGGIISQIGTGPLHLTSNMIGINAGMGVVVTGGGVATMNGITDTTALINFNKQGPGTWTVNGGLTVKGGAIRAQGGILDFSATSSTTDDAIVGIAATGRTNGGVIRFATGSSIKTASANTNGIIGGWATVDNSTWAVSNGAGNAISGLASFVSDAWAASNNTDVTLTGAAPASGSSTNSLRFNESGAKTLTLAGTNTVTSGGILVTPTVGAGATSMAGGTLAISNFTNSGGISGAMAGDLIIHQCSAGNLTMSSVIANIIPVARTGNFLINQKIITGLSSTADLVVGMSVTGSGIAANSTIASINSASQITLNNNTTVVGTATPVTFGAAANGLTKTGSGALILNSANTYTGTTRVYEGKVTVNAKGSDKVFEVASIATLELGYEVGTTVYNNGVTVYGAGTAATTGLYLKGGFNYGFGNSLRLTGSPTTVRTYGTGVASLHGWDTNKTPLVVDATASGSILSSSVKLNVTSFGYVMNIAAGPSTATADLTIEGFVQGDRPFIKNGYGSVKLMGASTNVAAFEIRQGSLILSGGDNRLGNTSNVILGTGTASGELILDGVSQTLVGITISGTGLQNSVRSSSAALSSLVINNSAATALTANLGGAGLNENNLELVKINTGELMVSGNNTYTGGTKISAGVLTLGSKSALGTSGDITMNGGTLRFTASNTEDYTAGGRLKLADGKKALIDTNGLTVTFANPLRYDVLADGVLTKIGNGVLSLAYSTSNGSKLSDTASLELAGGTLRLSGGSHEEIVAATLVSADTIIDRSSGAATINLGIISHTNSATLDIAEAGVARTTMANDISGKLPSWITVGGQAAAKDGLGNIIVYSNFTDVFRLGGLIQNNPISNTRIVNGGASGNVTLQSAGTTDIATLIQNANAGPAVVKINVGQTLRLGEEGAIVIPAGKGQLTIEGENLTAGGANDTDGSILVDADEDIKISALLNDNGLGRVALMKTGAGTLELTQENLHSGGTTLIAGKLLLGNDLALGLGMLTIDGGSLDNSMGAPITITDVIPQTWNGSMNFIGTNDLHFTAGIVTLTADQVTTVNQGVLTISGKVNGAKKLTKAGSGSLVLGGGGDWNGITTVTGGTLEVIGKTNDVPYVINSDATLKLDYSTQANYANTNLKITGNGIAATTGFYLKGGSSYNASGTIEILAAPTTIRQYGSGLAAIGIFDNNGTGIRTVAPSSGSVVESNIQLVSRGYGMTVDTAIGTATATGDLVINGPLNVGSGGFFKRGPGSVALNAAATTGNLGLHILDGSVITGVANAIGANSLLDIASGKKLVLQGFSQVTSTLQGAGQILNGSATPAVLTVNQAAVQTFSGILGGAGANEGNFSFVKAGLFELTLSGANNYAGSTTVAAGTLTITQPVLADTANVLLTSGAILNLTTGVTDTIDKLIVDGVAEAPGIYGSLSSSAQFKRGYITGNGTLTVTTGGTGGYASWEIDNGVVGAGAAADSDGDGVSNGIEYVLGGSTAAQDAGKLPVITTPGGNMVFTFKRAQSSKTAEVTTTIEVGTTLSAFPSHYNVGNDTVGSDTGVVVFDNGDGTDTVTLTIAKGADVKKFARLKVTIN